MAVFNVSFEVNDPELANFIARILGQDPGRAHKVAFPVVNGDEDEGPVNADAPAVDKFGVPYDARYHAKTKNFTQDGAWKRAKGLSDADKAAADAFEAAAKASAAAPVATVTAAAPVATLPVAAPVETPAPVAAVVGLPTGLPTGLPMPVAPVAPPPVSLEDVTTLFQKAMAVDASVAANYMTLYAEAGITDPNALTTDESKRAALATLLKTKYPAIAA